MFLPAHLYVQLCSAPPHEPSLPLCAAIELCFSRCRSRCHRRRAPLTFPPRCLQHLVCRRAASALECRDAAHGRSCDTVVAMPLARTRARTHSGKPKASPWPLESPAHIDHLTIEPLCTTAQGGRASPSPCRTPHQPTHTPTCALEHTVPLCCCSSDPRARCCACDHSSSHLSSPYTKPLRPRYRVPLQAVANLVAGRPFSSRSATGTYCRALAVCPSFNLGPCQSTVARMDTKHTAIMSVMLLSLSLVLITHR